MFTGIITAVSRVEGTTKKDGSVFVSVRRPGWKIKNGESIAMNGICSTVCRVSKAAFVVEYMPETLAKTTALLWKKGTALNLERSMRLSDPLDGHIVQGHVDGTGTILGIRREGGSDTIKIKVPKKLMGFIAPKGAIAVDGVSLTVVETGADWFTVALVGYTLAHTNLGAGKAGATVNVETDMIAKYLRVIVKRK